MPAIDRCGSAIETSDVSRAAETWKLRRSPRHLVMARLGRAIYDFKREYAHICRESAGIISSAAGKLMDGRAKRDHDGREDECPGLEPDSRGLGPRIHEFACCERHDSAEITALSAH